MPLVVVIEIDTEGDNDGVKDEVNDWTVVLVVTTGRAGVVVESTTAVVVV